MKRGEIATETIRAEAPIMLPPGTPLLAKTRQAVKIFGMSTAALYRLRQRYPDFAALTVRTGKDVMYDVPRCYAWFGQWLGAEIEAE